MPDDQHPEKSVAILTSPGVTMLDLVGTHSFLNGLMMAKYKVITVAKTKEPVQSDTPLKMVPDKSFDEAPSPAILVVVGGGLPWLAVLAEPAIRGYVLRAAESAEWVVSTGAGSLLLAALGMLKGRQATTYWPFSGMLEALGAQYVQQRWVEEGKVITCAAGTGGMDFGLKLVARLSGEANARSLQLMAEYEPEPPFGAIDWSSRNGANPFPIQPGEIETLREALAGQPEVLQAFNAWISEKISVR